MYNSNQIDQNQPQLDKNPARQVADTIQTRQKQRPSEYNTKIKREHPFHQQYVSNCCAKIHSPIGWYSINGEVRQSKCRNPRCTPDCWCRYNEKQACILSQYVKSLPSNYRLFYFNCKFPQSIEADKNCKKLFRQHMEQLEDTLGITVRFRCWLHITKTGFHYDGIIYSNADIRHQVRSVFREELNLSKEDYCCIEHKDRENDNR